MAENESYRQAALWQKEWRGHQHSAPVTKIVPLPIGGKLATISKDGTMRVWSHDLRLLQTLEYSATVSKKDASPSPSGTPPPSNLKRQHPPWATDALLQTTSAQQRLFISSNDRSITLFRILPAELDPDLPDETNCLARAATLRLPVAVGPATCLACLPRGGEPQSSSPNNNAQNKSSTDDMSLVFGDQNGGVSCLPIAIPPTAVDQGTIDLPCASRRLLHKAHSAAVTQLMYIPRVGLLSSSLDATVQIYDPGRDAVTATSSVHGTGAVRCMAFHPGLSLVASGGAQRSVLLWHPRGDPNRAVGELPGHVHGTVGIQIATSAGTTHQMFTLAGDGMVSLWDLRTLRRLQCINLHGWLSHEDASPSALSFDTGNDRLLTATRRPAVWHRGDSKSPSCFQNVVPHEGSVEAVSSSPGEPSSLGEGEGGMLHKEHHEDAGAAVQSEWMRRPYSKLHLGSIP